MAAAAGEGQYSVNLEWVDPYSQLLRPFQLKFYEVDSTLEIFDTRQKRMFLKRVAPPEGTKLAELYVGNTVTIYSRKMKVVSYADERTARFFTRARSRCLAILLPRAVRRAGAVLEGIQEAGMEVGRLRLLRLSAAQVAKLDKIGGGAGSGADLTTGPVLAMELVAPDCWSTATLLGRGSPGLRISPSEACADAEVDYCFDEITGTTATHRDCTLCIVRPYAVADGTAATIIKDIQAAGYAISAMETVQFTATDAADLYSAYKGVVNEYAQWTSELSSGPAIAMELVGADVAAKFREFVGPYNPEIAQLLRPDTLRAKHGRDPVRNAVHCTDLPTDGPLESKFVFHVIQNA